MPTIDSCSDCRRNNDEVLPLNALRSESHRPHRYTRVSQEKSGGVTYTPRLLADFVARQVVQTGEFPLDGRPIRVLDPAFGHGELLISLIHRLLSESVTNIEVCGFETDSDALQHAIERLTQEFPKLNIDLRLGSFLDFVLDQFGANDQSDLFRRAQTERYDMIIANPPYVRTQIIGARRAQALAKQFGLSGRLDLYYAFVLAMSRALKPDGTIGLIVSNRFMKTKSGAVVRKALIEQLNVRRAWDLGDTKLFNAAVLPAVIILEGKERRRATSPGFTSIYETQERASYRVPDPLSALDREGIVRTDDGRRFHVQHGRLDTSGTDDGVWRLANSVADGWLSTVSEHSWKTFRGLGRVRVGVKTCADNVFIRNDWARATGVEYPELLRPLITHHMARRFKPSVLTCPFEILYPHENVRGRRRAVDLTRFPHSLAYLEAHRATLESRHYVKASGRKWYEIWVPQNPDAWKQRKLVFRDIANQPTFWIDLNGSVVNGDCYWLTCDDSEDSDLLWLAASVGNSTFIERFYDYRFNNKLYAGRRRFMTQYVETFPLPNPQGSVGQEIVAKSKLLFESMPSSEDNNLLAELNALVWESFGLIEEANG